MHDDELEAALERDEAEAAEREDPMEAAYERDQREARERERGR